MLVGYARMSTPERNPAHQVDALTRAGVTDVVCVRCGEGPLLAGDAADAAEQTPPPAPVLGWLSAAGWELSGLVCPDCVGELAR